MRRDLEKLLRIADHCRRRGDAGPAIGILRGARIPQFYQDYLDLAVDEGLLVRVGPQADRMYELAPLAFPVRDWSTDPQEGVL